MANRADKIPQKGRAVVREARYVNRFALLAEGAPRRRKSQAADLLDIAQKLIPQPLVFVKWLIKSAGERYEDMLHEQASTIALLEYRLRPRRRGRPRKPQTRIDDTKRNRGRPKSWNDADLLRFYELGRAALLAEGVERPTYRQCLAQAARAVNPQLTARQARQCVKELSLAQRLSDARKTCGK